MLWVPTNSPTNTVSYSVSGLWTYPYIPGPQFPQPSPDLGLLPFWHHSLSSSLLNFSALPCFTLLVTESTSSVTQAQHFFISCLFLIPLVFQELSVAKSINSILAIEPHRPFPLHYCHHLNIGLPLNLQCNNPCLPNSNILNFPDTLPLILTSVDQRKTSCLFIFVIHNPAENLAHSKYSNICWMNQSSHLWKPTAPFPFLLSLLFYQNYLYYMWTVYSLFKLLRDRCV